MASDLKIEIFASQFFERYWYRAGLLSHQLGVSSLYPQEYYLDSENATLCEESHLMAVYVKHLFYYGVFYKEFVNFSHDLELSPSFISDYISRTFVQDGLFGSQSVFELLFSSCAFVVHLCFDYVGNYGYRDILSYVHLCWAMYFDEYKEEFYRQGGWYQLKIVSDSYVLQFEVSHILSNKLFNSNEEALEFLRNAKKAVDNRITFKRVVQNNLKTVSKTWVKFHLQNINKSESSGLTADMKKLQDMSDPNVVENFLVQFRRFCDPNGFKDFNIRAQSNYHDSRKRSTEKVSRSLSKLKTVALNSLTGDTSREPDDKQKKQDMQETDDPTDKSIDVDLSRDKRNEDQTDEPSVTDFPPSKDSATNQHENDRSQSASLLKLKMTSSVDFSEKKTLTASELKLNKNKKEVDLERESPEVKCLLRMILVLGNASGIIHVRSSLPCLDTHQRKKK